jgi:hypothetical protein
MARMSCNPVPTSKGIPRDLPILLDKDILLQVSISAELRNVALSDNLQSYAHGMY